MVEMSQTSADGEVSSQANTPKDSRPVYEVGFHVVPTVTEAEVGDAVESLRSELGKIKAEIISEQFPNKMTLAYIIERAAAGKREKFSESYFGWIKFVIEERGAIPTFETFLQHNKQILRYLLVETVREEAVAPRRAIFSSNRLEGETIKKPTGAPEAAAGEVSEEELNKSLDALVS